VVLDAVAGEHADAAVIHAHRKMNDELALGLAKDRAHAGIESQALGGSLELGHGDLVGIGTLHLIVHVSRHPLVVIDFDYCDAARRRVLSSIRRCIATCAAGAWKSRERRAPCAATAAQACPAIKD